MGVEVVLPTAAAVVSLYAALFHGWVYGLHRAARDHAWVAVCAGGAALVCLGTAAMVAGETPADALRAQRIQVLGAPAVTVGLLRFAASHFHAQRPWLMRAGDGFLAIVMTLALADPGALIDVDRPPRVASSLGVAYLQYDYTRLTHGLLPLAFVFVFATAGLALQARRTQERHATPLLLALGGWVVAAIHDSAVAMGLRDSLYWMPSGGYLVLVVTISTILLRELVLALDEAERLGARLQELAHARADELRVVELRLARGEQLAAVGTLAAGVAHEINNPLAYVSANLNHLQTLWEEKNRDPAEVEEVLSECREGLHRVGAISSDLLRMARHGASERQELDLSEVVRSVLPLAEREADGEVRISASLARGLRVLGSARLLGQVALNLMLNAIRASGTRGRAGRGIEVETRACGDPAPGCELAVHDHGAGMPEALREQLFGAGFASRPIGQGTGLGLALVRLIVTRHGGAIRAESGAHGTVVRVWLPAYRGGSPP
jgi:signal transduction histidine kinase